MPERSPFRQPSPFERPSLLQKRGTTDQHSTYVGPEGEITIDTDKQTVVVQDGETLGGHPLARADASYTRISYLTFRAALSQGGAASLGFCCPDPTQAPTPISIAGRNTIIGAAAFAPNAVQSVQDHFIVPPDWVTPLDVEILWRAQATTGNVIWEIETAGWDAAQDLDAPFNPASQAQAFPGGTGFQLVTTTIQNIDTTDIQPNTELFFRFSRTGGNMSSPAELISLRFLIRRNSI